jgi:hypothetical protein
MLDDVNQERRGRSVQDADSRPTHEQAAADFGEPNTSSNGKRQSEAIDEEYDRRVCEWEHNLSKIEGIEVASKLLIESKAKGIGARRKGSAVGQPAGKRGQLGPEADPGGRE